MRLISSGDLKLRKNDSHSAVSSPSPVFLISLVSLIPPAVTQHVATQSLKRRKKTQDELQRGSEEM